MTETLILLAPVLVLIIVALFGFTGCGKLLPPAAEPPPEPPTPPPPVEPPIKKYAEAIAEMQGLVAHWPLNETAGTTAGTNPPGLNLNGTYVGAAGPGGPGAFGHKEPMANFAAALDGATGYIEVPFDVKLNEGLGPRFSIEVWVKPAAAIAAGQEQIVISSHHTAANGNQRGYEVVLVGSGGAHATIRARVFSLQAPLVSTVDITPAQGDPLAWRHIVLTYDAGGAGIGNKLELYASVTGAPANPASASAPGTAPYSSVQAGGQGERPLRFGAGHLQAGGPEKFFKGLIDEVALYSRVLVKSEVDAHFNLF